MKSYAGIELGGTKIVCGLATEAGEVVERVRFDTSGPEHALPRAQEVLDRFAHEHGPFAGLGIGTFGPVHLNADSSDYGSIGATPKLAWRGCDILTFFTARNAVPVALDTDVVAAAFGEARWGAARGAGSVVYVTVGTGIGAGVLVDGVPLHGLMHPEVGHIRVPRAAADDYQGGCPHHGDCIEGLAAGPAIQARWGAQLGELGSAHAAFDMEAHYLAHLVVNSILFYSPQIIVMGGGVMSNEALFPRIRERAQSLLNGYVALPEVEERIDEMIVPPGLGDNAGILGAAAMAQAAAG